MDFRQCFALSETILLEGALGERLKREYQLQPDDFVSLAAMVYSDKGQMALKELWQQYIAIAQVYHLPFLATTPTRRANKERVQQGGYSSAIIADNVRFLRQIQARSETPMFIGGLMGCKGDAYTGAGALPTEQAKTFHSWQADLFRQAEVDFLYAGIMPTLPEAIGMAQAMADTTLPYIISFTITENGCLIDHTPIARAIETIDNSLDTPPICYMANCIHPQLAQKALLQPFNHVPLVRERFLGIQANTSPLPYDQLDNALNLHTTDPATFAQDMLTLYNTCHLKIIGGCCGTDDRHMRATAQAIVRQN